MDYEHKYLKYKQKYLELKYLTQIGGKTEGNQYSDVNKLLKNIQEFLKSTTSKTLQIYIKKNRPLIEKAVDPQWGQSSYLLLASLSKTEILDKEALKIINNIPFTSLMRSLIPSHKPENIKDIKDYVFEFS